jgi:hypothetical protein
MCRWECWLQTYHGTCWVKCGFSERCGISVQSWHGNWLLSRQMKSSNFEKWVRCKLLQHLPANSVVVLDNAPYHSVQVGKARTKCSVKSEMVSCLQRHGVTCDSTMRKGPLYDMILTKKPRGKIFKIDQLLTEHGHTFLRLPLYN